jgi:catechol 2,3-dioxygenase-like lactoylglutathione lyase family enzyme
MSELPRFGVRVTDLPASIEFYAGQIGFKLVAHHPASDTAHILDSDGDLMLLAGPKAGDVSQYLAEKHLVLEPHGTLTFHGGDIDALQAMLDEGGVQQLELVETRWGDRILRVTDPDNYTLSFSQPVQHTFTESLDLYLRGVDELEAAIAGLSDQDLDFSRRPGDWTIRQIVHHVADGETLFALAMKMALAEPGRTFLWNWPNDNANYGRKLASDQRPIAPSIAFTRANRELIAQIAQHLPDTAERTVVGEDGQARSFDQMTQLCMRHCLEHVDDIHAIRKAHGL